MVLCGRVEESRQVNYCVTVIVIGAGLFIVSSSLNRGNIMSALAILGAILLLIGILTLLLVLLGISTWSHKKNQRVQNNPISVTDGSGPGYEHDSIWLSRASQCELMVQEINPSTTVNPVISLPVCPKIIVPVQVQPPPTYDEVVAMSSRERTDSFNKTTKSSCQESKEIVTLPCNSQQ